MSADRPNAADILPPTGGTTPTPPTAGGPKIISLGNGYSIVYPDPSAPYDYQIVADKALPAAGAVGESLSPNTVYSNQQQNTRSAADLAEQARQFNENFGMAKARGDQQQQLAQGEALGVYNGQNTVSRDRLNLDALTQQQNYYKYLSDVASNPRNFVQTFFQSRGQTAPLGSSQYGNGGLMRSYGAPSPAGTPTTPMNQVPQQSYAPQQAAQPQMQTGSPYNPAADPNRGTRFEGLSGFNTDGTLRLAPNDPDAAKLMAAHPGQYRVGFASGGVIPEPVVGVGLHSGQTYRFGENGPEGVVPAQYLPHFLQQRHGQAGGFANGGIIGVDSGGGDPYATDPYATQTTPDPLAPPPYTPNQPYSTAPWSAPAQTPNDPSNPYSQAYNPHDVQTTQSYGPQVPTGYGPVMTPSVDYSAAGAAMAAAANAANPNVNKLAIPQVVPQTPQSGATTAPTVQPTPPVDPYAALKTQLGTAGTAPIVEPLEPPIPPPMQMIRQPVQLPQGGGTPGTQSNLTAGAPLPREVSAPGTFGNISGNMPSFLPGEDQQGSVLQALLANNALPPFLSRLFAQSRGIQSQGTNQPQNFNLPPDLPLVSKLAWLQMQPSEQQALLSYASANGVTPEDYLAAIEAASPQGSSAQTPNFGNAFSYARQ